MSPRESGDRESQSQWDKESQRVSGTRSPRESVSPRESGGRESQRVSEPQRVSESEGKEYRESGSHRESGGSFPFIRSLASSCTLVKLFVVISLTRPQSAQRSYPQSAQRSNPSQFVRRTPLSSFRLSLWRQMSF